MRTLPYGGGERVVVQAARQLAFRPGLCALCTGTPPAPLYGAPMYCSRFMQSYLPYHSLLARQTFGHDILDQDSRRKEIENAVRERLGCPRIGERWISETMLYRVVQQLLSPLEVQQHYRGIELEGLELDIWVPAPRLGIEYQGEQHSQPIAHWGGEEGLRKRQANDRKKRRLCRALGYELVEFSHDEAISADAVARRLERFLLKS